MVILDTKQFDMIIGIHTEDLNILTNILGEYALMVNGAFSNDDEAQIKAGVARHLRKQLIEAQKNAK